MIKTILVLGAGTGGIITARELSKKVKKENLIESELFFLKKRKKMFSLLLYFG